MKRFDVTITDNDASALSIVAIHGIQGTRSSWDPVVKLLQNDARWIQPNLRGRAHAFRGSQVSDYILEKFAADIAEVIATHVTTPNFVLAGWSMGVSVTLATIALLQRENLPLPAALILMSGSPVLKQTTWFQQTDYEPLLQEIEAREVRLGLREAADRDAVAWTWQAIHHTDQRPLLPAIEIPTLIVHGSDDEDSPLAHAHLLAHDLPNTSLRIIDGGKHSILTQNTVRVADEMRSFLSTIATHGVTHANQ